MSSIIKTIPHVIITCILSCAFNLSAQDNNNSPTHNELHPAVKAYLEAQDPIVGSANALRIIAELPTDELSISDVQAVLQHCKDRAIVGDVSIIIKLIDRYFSLKDPLALRAVYKDKMIEFRSHPRVYAIQINTLQDAWVIVDLSKKYIQEPRSMVYNKIREIAVADTNLIVGAPQSLGRHSVKPNTEYLIAPYAQRDDLEYTGKKFVGGGVFQSEQDPTFFYSFNRYATAQTNWNAGIDYTDIYQELGQYSAFEYIGQGFFLVTTIGDRTKTMRLPDNPCEHLMLRGF